MLARLKTLGVKQNWVIKSLKVTVTHHLIIHDK